MKRNIIICLLLLTISLVFVSGCSNADDMPADDGKFLGVVSGWDIDFDNEEGVADVIIDEKLALEIGNAVLKSVLGQDIITDTEFLVCEFKDKDIFIVSRSLKEYEMGEDYCVAISKKDGAILRVWQGE